MNLGEIGCIVKLYEDDDAFEMVHLLDAFRCRGDALSSLTKTIRLLERSFIRMKENYLLKSLISLGQDEDNDIYGCEMGNNESVHLNPSSVWLAKEFVSYVAAEMTTPNVNKDSRGCVCFEWGTVYGKYLLIRFCDHDNYTLFWQSSSTSEVKRQKCHYQGMLECQKMLPWRM